VSTSERAEAIVSEPRNLNELFLTAVERFGSKQAALRVKRDGAWQDITHQELARRVKHAALGLKAIGIAPGDHVAILSHNRPEWAIVDYACLSIGCADVPVYPTLPTPQVSYILQDSASRAVFVENADQYEKVAAIRDEIPQVEHVIAFDVAEGMDGPGVISFQELLQRGAAAEPDHPTYRDDALAVPPDALATLIYTSGTTGPPKGVMLTHANFCTNVVSALQVLSIGPEDHCLSAAPLSHSFERMAGHYTMLHAGTTINYAESIEQIPSNLLETRPTIMIFVPRLYEKLYARVLENATTSGALKRRIFYWARRNAEQWAERTMAQQPVPTSLQLKKRIADRLVFSKLQARTGGRIRFFVSGAAPLNPEIAKFFYAAGLPVVEGYGLTESSPVIAANPLERIKVGTVGPPIPGVEVRIAPDGEILARGPNIMRGYFNKPQETAEALDEEGWLHTGDIGELDEDRYLRITDRKKDLIVTAGGKKVAPQPIENMIKTNPFVLNAVMVGDKRRYPVLLIVPDLDKVKAFATERGLPPADDEALLELPDVRAKLEREVMGTLRDLASFEMPKRMAFLPRDFTIDAGELTPTLKVKRRVVEDRYASVIEELYSD
jgi:long-chain acyl-CoA synthetase